MHLPDVATDVAVDRLSRSRGELHGELLVTSGLPGTRSSTGHLHQARFNLSGSETRSRVAKAIGQRAGGMEVDWLDVLEDFCRRVLAAEREGTPPIRVGALPRAMGVEWRLDPLIPVGKPVILYGEGGTGKSTLAAACAVSVETGISVVPGFIPRKASVLYLDWESDQDEINDRVRSVAMGAHLPGPASILYRACHGPLADQVEDLARLVAEHSIGLVVVDSVGLAAGTSSDGGDAAESALRMFAAFRVLEAARHGCSILAIDHVSKAETEVSGRSARPYGSIYKVNLARAMFELRRGVTMGSTTNLGLYNTKSNVRGIIAPIGLEVDHADDGSVLYARSEHLPERSQSTLAERIYAALSEGHLEISDIAKAIREPENKVRATLSRYRDNLFGRLPSGEWEALPRAS